MGLKSSWPSTGGVLPNVAHPAPLHHTDVERGDPFQRTDKVGSPAWPTNKGAADTGADGFKGGTPPRPRGYPRKKG
jgi:hypothetical protein